MHKPSNIGYKKKTKHRFLEKKAIPTQRLFLPNCANPGENANRKGEKGGKLKKEGYSKILTLVIILDVAKYKANALYQLQKLCVYSKQLKVLT